MKIAVVWHWLTATSRKQGTEPVVITRLLRHHEQSERQFEIDASEDNEQVTVDKLCQLAPDSITSIVAKVENIEAPVSVQSKTKL